MYHGSNAMTKKWTPEVREKVIVAFLREMVRIGDDRTQLRRSFDHAQKLEVPAGPHITCSPAVIRVLTERLETHMAITPTRRAPGPAVGAKFIPPEELEPIHPLNVFDLPPMTDLVVIGVDWLGSKLNPIRLNNPDKKLLWMDASHHVSNMQGILAERGYTQLALRRGHVRFVILLPFPKSDLPHNAVELLTLNGMPHVVVSSLNSVSEILRHPERFDWKRL